MTVKKRQRMIPGIQRKSPPGAAEMPDVTEKERGGGTIIPKSRLNHLH